jgi:hypothetical protein
MYLRQLFPCVYYFTIIFGRAVLRLWQHYLFMLSIKSWMVEDILTAYYTLFNMLRWNIYQLHRVSKFQVVMHIFYLTVICIPIQSHQSHLTPSTTLRSFIDCEYCSYLFLLNTMTYNTCIRVCIVYAV